MRWEAEKEKEKERGGERESGGEGESGGGRWEAEQHWYVQGGKAGIPGVEVKKWKKAIGDHFQQRGGEDWGAGEEKKKWGEKWGEKGVDKQKGGEEKCVNLEPVHLNVGGVRYTTTLSTLSRLPDTLIGRRFSTISTPTQPNESYFIDRDGTHFRHILNYLRSGGSDKVYKWITGGELEELRRECEFYGIDQLMFPTDTDTDTDTDSDTHTSTTDGVRAQNLASRDTGGSIEYELGV
ncbi:BTB/POZ protein [Ochromonadaceae sp. CCMP2298]|nr:BTB/POZ protein [Ochromonadaceae sp. CCMP2298]